MLQALKVGPRKQGKSHAGKPCGEPPPPRRRRSSSSRGRSLARRPGLPSVDPPRDPQCPARTRERAALTLIWVRGFYAPASPGGGEHAGSGRRRGSRQDEVVRIVLRGVSREGDCYQRYELLLELSPDLLVLKHFC